MLGRTQLLRLERALRDTPVLSVYGSTRTVNPAERRAWRIALDDELDRVRDSLKDESPEERRSFRSAAAHVREYVDARPAELEAPGFVMFATADGVRLAVPLAAGVETCAAWTRGAQLAPAMNGGAGLRSTFVAVMELRRARLFRVNGDSVVKLATIRPKVSVGPVYHTSASRPGFGPNTRGRAGADEADRVQRAVAERLRTDIVRRLGLLAGNDGWIVIGGAPEASLGLATALPESLRGRSLVSTTLGSSAGEKDVLAAAHAARTKLHGQRMLALVEDAIERYGAGTAALGLGKTAGALDALAVRELMFTPRFARLHSARTEDLIRRALDQGAAVEQLAGTAADLLDERGGVGALLRFHPAVAG